MEGEDRRVMARKGSLEEVEAGKDVVVVEIDGGAPMRRHLSSLGIHIGDIVHVRRQAPWGGPLLIEVHGIEVALGRGVAARVKVEEV